MAKNDETSADWLVSTAKRHPEALLVLAAGAILLLRGRASEDEDWRTAEWDDEEDEAASGGSARERGVTEAVRERVSDFAQAATDYAADVGEQVLETAADYAEQGRRYAYDHASRFSSQAHGAADWVIREQPLAVAALGLAAGAAVAALLPSTEIEERALGPARERLADVARSTTERLKEAAEDAATEMKANVVDRVLGGDALREAGKAFGNSFKTGER